jgi:membrane protein
LGALSGGDSSRPRVLRFRRRCTLESYARAESCSEPPIRDTEKHSGTMSTQVRDVNPGTYSQWRWQARRVLRESLVNFYRADSLTISASIAYHCLLAIFPLLLLLLGMTGIYIRRFEMAGRLALVLEQYLPVRPDFIMRNLLGISRAYGRIGLVSFLLLLWSSSGVFLPLEKAFNRAWEVEKERSWWRKRLLALEMAITVGFFFLVSSGVMGVNIYIHNLLRHWVTRPFLPLAEFGYDLLIVVTTFGMTLAMFILLFERLPNRTMGFRQVLPSALFTALFWEAARSGFALMLPFFNYRQVYGSIGVVVALMTWAYLSSAVMLFGAQVSRALYRTFKAPAPVELVAASPTVESPAKAP